MRLGVVLGACALSLTGCGGSAPDHPPADERAGWEGVTATNDAFSLEVPDGWSVRKPWLHPPVVVAVKADTGAERLLVSSYDDEVRAEEEAITTSGILSGSNIFCERLDGTDVFGGTRLVFDCPEPRDGEATSRRVLVPMTDDGRSALLLVQTHGESLEATAGLIRPILDSWTWE